VLTEAPAGERRENRSSTVAEGLWRWAKGPLQRGDISRFKDSSTPEAAKDQKLEANRRGGRREL